MKVLLLSLAPAAPDLNFIKYTTTATIARAAIIAMTIPAIAPAPGPEYVLPLIISEEPKINKNKRAELY